MAVNKFNPESRVKIVSIFDGAIDQENSDLDKYQEDHKLEHLKFKEGEHPTFFILKNVISTKQAEIQEDHFKIEMPDLDPVEMAKKTKEELAKIRPTIKREKQTEMMIKWFNAACSSYEEAGKEFPCNADMFSLSIVQEIGSVAMLRSQLGE